MAVLIRSHPGVLLHIDTSEIAWIEENTWFGKPKGITVRPWEEKVASEVVFTAEYGQECSAYPVGITNYFLLARMGDDSFPPSHIAEFLGIDQLFRVPHGLLYYLPQEAWHGRS